MTPERARCRMIGKSATAQAEGCWCECHAPVGTYPPGGMGCGTCRPDDPVAVEARETIRSEGRARWQAWADQLIAGAAYCVWPLTPGTLTGTMYIRAGNHWRCVPYGSG